MNNDKKIKQKIDECSKSEMQSKVGEGSPGVRYQQTIMGKTCEKSRF